mmetsp:Transcript_19552/g.56270  ORF Transcript_19552/g.56270 Transcript_19552/m.56270 type:complete len:208 (-) Transcript_19552:429-1052(-)
MRSRRVTLLGLSTWHSSLHHETRDEAGSGFLMRIQQGPISLRLTMKFSMLEAPAPKIFWKYRPPFMQTSSAGTGNCASYTTLRYLVTSRGTDASWKAYCRSTTLPPQLAPTRLGTQAGCKTDLSSVWTSIMDSYSSEPSSFFRGRTNRLRLLPETATQQLTYCLGAAFLDLGDDLAFWAALTSTLPKSKITPLRLGCSLASVQKKSR